MKIYDPTPDMTKCYHILFDMLSSNFRSECGDLIYLRYTDYKNREKLSLTLSLHRPRACFVDYGIDILL